MIRLFGAASIALAVLSGAPAWAASPADSPVNVPEPEGFWTGPPKAYTPKTLTGATVVDIDALDKLVAAEKPVMIDVAMADQKPVGFPTDRPWLPAHRSIPGSVWMPGAGAAPMAPAREAQFLAPRRRPHRRRQVETGGHLLPSRMLGQLECRQAPAPERLYPRLLVRRRGRGLAGQARHHDPEGRWPPGPPSPPARRRDSRLPARQRPNSGQGVRHDDGQGTPSFRGAEGEPGMTTWVSKPVCTFPWVR